MICASTNGLLLQKPRNEIWQNLNQQIEVQCIILKAETKYRKNQSVRKNLDQAYLKPTQSWPMILKTL